MTRELPHQDILDKDRHVADVREHYASQLDLLLDLVNYGTNLIPRAYNTGPKLMTEAIVIGV